MKIQHYAILWEEDDELEAVQKLNLIWSILHIPLTYN